MIVILINDHPSFIYPCRCLKPSSITIFPNFFVRQHALALAVKTAVTCRQEIVVTWTSDTGFTAVEELSVFPEDFESLDGEVQLSDLWLPAGAREVVQAASSRSIVQFVWGP